MTFNPKISVIVPVYNGANYLAEALDSILAQTYRNFEIVVVNDGSKDDGATAAVAKTYGDKIRYFEKENGGVASALNFAVSCSDGEYISWLSHDDLYTPEKLQRAVDRLSEEDTKDAIIYSDFSVFTQSPEQDRAVRLRSIRPDQFRYWITVENSLHGCTLLIPRDAFETCGTFDEALWTTQDYDLWFRMAKKFRFIHVPEVLVKARSHDMQGTIALADTALRECDELLVKFVRDLSHSELRAGVDGDVSIAYLQLVQSMQVRGFEQATETAQSFAMEFPVKHSARTRISQLKYVVKSSMIRGVLQKAKSVVKMIVPPKVLENRHKVDIVNKLPLKEKFSQVYAENIFGGEVSRSGAGSDLEQTAVIRSAIPEILQKYDVKSMLDAPCGDWFWMQHVDLGIDKYIGADIVEDMIKANQERFGRDGVEFACLDLSKDELPPVDLIFSRDCLVHLSFEDAMNILKNFKKSGAKYLLTTTFTERKSNEDLGSGFWRALNKQVAPFDFPHPLELVNEKCTEANNMFTDKSIGLWDLQALELK